VCKRSEQVREHKSKLPQNGDDFIGLEAQQVLRAIPIKIVSHDASPRCLFAREVGLRRLSAARADGRGQLENAKHLLAGADGRHREQLLQIVGQLHPALVEELLACIAHQLLRRELGETGRREAALHLSAYGKERARQPTNQPKEEEEETHSIMEEAEGGVAHGCFPFMALEGYNHLVGLWGGGGSDPRLKGGSKGRGTLTVKVEPSSCLET